MNASKTITICGQEVRLLYCAAAENGFEDYAGKSITEFDINKVTDLMNLSLACIVCAYSKESKEPPISSADLLYEATSQDIEQLYIAVCTLRAEWYNIPKVVQDSLSTTDAEEKEPGQTEEKEKEKNA